MSGGARPHRDEARLAMGEHARRALRGLAEHRRTDSTSPSQKRCSALALTLAAEPFSSPPGVSMPPPTPVPTSFTVSVSRARGT